MIRPAFDEEEEKPLDPAVEKVRRKLMRFVAINLGLLFVALMAVVAAIVYKNRSEGEIAAGQSVAEIPVAAGAVLEGDIEIPAGARIVSQALSGSRLSLEIELPDGRRAIHLYDLTERRTVGRFAIVAR
jgi:hypothetical protein